MPAKLVYDSGNYATLFRQGKEKGFAWFFRNLYPPLSFHAFKIIGDKEVSEEIASQAFMKIWQRHEQFLDAFSIKKYLYRIVRNDALKYLRKQKQTTSFHKEVVYLYDKEVEQDCFKSLVSAEIARELLAAINALPAECSKVLRLLFLEGKSIQETAAALQVSPSTVKTQKARGLTALRKKLAYYLFLLTGFILTLFYSV